MEVEMGMGMGRGRGRVEIFKESEVSQTAGAIERIN